MSAEQVFVDTNILVYAHDLDAAERHDQAQQHLAELWRRKAPPAISVQVLQELYTTLIQKRVPQNEAEDVVPLYLKWNVIENTGVAAARQAGARQLWSEDFSVGQDYDGVRVVNPLKD